MPGNEHNLFQEYLKRLRIRAANGDQDAIDSLKKMQEHSVKSRQENKQITDELQDLTREYSVTDVLIANQESSPNVFVNDEGDVLPTSEGPDIKELKYRMYEIADKVDKLYKRLEEKQK